MAIAVLLVIGVVAANLPWFSERILFVMEPRTGHKRVVIRIAEWALMYCLWVLAGFGLERTVDGGVHPQDWIFFVVTACLFAVFAAPGVIWRKDLRPLWASRPGGPR